VSWLFFIQFKDTFGSILKIVKSEKGFHFLMTTLI